MPLPPVTEDEASTINKLERSVQLTREMKKRRDSGLPTPYNKKVQRIVTMMYNASVAKKTGILMDVMSGFESGRWSAPDVRDILTAYNDQVRELLSFVDGDC